MDNIILASIITGLGVIVAAFISPYLTNKYKVSSEPFRKIASNRKNALYGRWTGIIEQKKGKKFMCNKHHAILIFNDGTHPIEGEIHLKLTVEEGINVLNNKHEVKAKLQNTIFDGYIFKTDYINNDHNSIHMGTIYGKISADGNSINGEFLGYGIVSEMFVSGKISVIKE